MKLGQKLNRRPVTTVDSSDAPVAKVAVPDGR